jgi:predicted HAD superfamily Cof-like phosphohydrolase
MKDQLDMLVEFHTTGDVYLEEKPTIDIPSSVSELRTSLLEEELDEYRVAVKGHDLVGVADALTDLMYVLLGTYVSYGLQSHAEELFNEVHRSNMSKFNLAEQTMRREDGKVLKPISFSAPDIQAVLNRKVKKE